MMKKSAVLYHYPCPDGAFAALAAHLYFSATSMPTFFFPNTVYTPLRYSYIHYIPLLSFQIGSFFDVLELNSTDPSCTFSGLRSFLCVKSMLLIFLILWVPLVLFRSSLLNLNGLLLYPFTLSICFCTNVPHCYTPLLIVVFSFKICLCSLLYV